MSRLFALLAVLSLVSSPLLAQEFAVTSSTNGGFHSAADPWSLSDRLDASLTAPFAAKGSGLSLKAHVQAAPLPTPLKVGLDLDELAVTLVFGQPAADLSSLDWTLGRFSIAEPTGLIFNHPGDGSKVTFRFKGSTVTVLAAYTGFILRESSGLTPSLADLAAADALLASPRLVGSVEGAFSPFPGHTVTLSALAQQDLNSRKALTNEWETYYKGDTGGRLDTEYLTLKAEGPLIENLYYEGFGTFGAGSTLSWLAVPSSKTGFLYEYKPITSAFFGASLSWFMPQVLSSSYTARILASTGDADASSTIEGNTKGNSTLFVPFTSSALGTVFSPALSNLLAYEVGGSAKPFAGVPLVATAKILGFQRSVAGVINATGVLRGGPLWLGQELDLGASWQPLSDLSLALSTGAFLPSQGTYASATPEDSLQLAVKAAVTLNL